MNDYKIYRRGLAVFVLIFAGIVYYLTVQPSVSFWDCGEYLATAYGLEIPHPPGAPLFLILARFFSMLPIAGNIAFRMNMISVLTSSFAVMMLYFVIIKVIENFRGKNYENLSAALIVYFTALIGALAHAFAYITWWNAVETEVYATNTFVFASIVLLLLIWNERADKVENEKFILLIAYLVGLSTSLRLMGALTTISITMLIMFRKYITDDKELKRTVYYFLIHAGILLVLGMILWAGQNLVEAPSAEQYKDFDTKFAAFMLIVSVFYCGIFWKKLFHRNSIYVVLISGGIILVLIYPGLVRYLPNLISKVVSTNNSLAIAVILVLVGGLVYAVYYSSLKGKATLNLVLKSFLFVLLGFTSYGIIIIRAGQTPPINENAPKNFNELVTYLNREQYGEWPTFQRRYSQESHQQAIYTSYSNDLDFLWNYQMNHMMTRYLLWNFAGRENWDQDSGPNIAPFNGAANIIGKLFGLHFAGDVSKSYFGIPFLIGLIGIYFHFKRDWKMAAVFLVLFLMITYITAYYQNQQEPQPRERIKFYGTMCFLFSIWISVGIYNIIDFFKNKYKSKSFSKLIPIAVLILAFVFIPLRMFSANYHEQDRSKDWLPWDFAYNLLQSCAPDAVLFTNGDNDTFPLWYMQEVEGVRRDVRIACLSLVNTNWYLLQLKNETPHGAKKVDMNLTDDEIQNISPVRWETQNIELPVPKETIASIESDKRMLIGDTTIAKGGKISFTMKPTAYYEGVGVVRPQDLAVLAIVQANNWKRPIYFAHTCSPDSWIGMDNYLNLEGMAYRLVPYTNASEVESINEPKLSQNLIEENYSFNKEYHPGFKYRGLNDKNIYFDDNHDRMLLNYRNLFIRLAYYYTSKKQGDKAVNALEVMKQKIDFNTNDIDYRVLFDLSKIYYSAGRMNKYKELADVIEQKALQSISKTPTNASQDFNPYSILLQTYENLGEFDKAKDIVKKLQVYYPNDQSLMELSAKYDSMKSTQMKNSPMDKVERVK